ncbi:hypothetical protein BaRGS_00038952 [Batillaria attramentaria]|uniref:Uncharacterized protein n=1 Tax=Batillaria attramentaria TaxID=370345 RepID=A0ABD0J4K7_9CAEN
MNDVTGVRKFTSKITNAWRTVTTDKHSHIDSDKLAQSEVTAQKDCKRATSRGRFLIPDLAKWLFDQGLRFAGNSIQRRDCSAETQTTRKDSGFQ